MQVLALWAAMAAANEWNITWEGLRSDSGWSESYAANESIGTVRVLKKEINGFPCFQGQSETSLGVPVLMSVATDITGAKRWSSAGITKAEVFAQGGGTIDYYQYLDIPFLSDRHWFLRGYIERKGTETRFRWDKIPSQAHASRIAELQAASDGAVEPPLNIGAWVFLSGDKKTEVRYYICTHPGGSVPASLQSIGTEKTLPNNVVDLIVEAQKRSK
ncbi:MAG: hypothetical protein VXZ96_00625 [Myxococcota bacterium]|nr:hypothetical protein [Myxococcota bacterium]